MNTLTISTEGVNLTDTLAQNCTNFVCFLFHLVMQKERVDSKIHMKVVIMHKLMKAMLNNPKTKHIPRSFCGSPPR